jgi:hypothetical protein
MIPYARYRESMAVPYGLKASLVGQGRIHRNGCMKHVDASGPATLTRIRRASALDVRERGWKGRIHVCRFRPYGRGLDDEPHFQCVECGVFMVRGVMYGPD